MMNRRKFLIAGAGAGAAGLLSGTAALRWHDLMRAAQDRPLPEGAGVLVIVTLYGGNDGINTLIPYADNAYHDARSKLAYAPGEVLHLDSELGLNPAMKGLAQLWNQRQLAIVRGVGYPQPDHSHFRSMDIWQTASPAEPVSTGWIGRWLDATGDDPLRAVNIGPVLPPLAVGEQAHGRGAFHQSRGSRAVGQVRRRHGSARHRRPRRHPGDGSGVQGLSRRAHHQRQVCTGQTGCTGTQLAGHPAVHGRQRGEGCGFRRGCTRCNWADSTRTPTNATPSNGCCIHSTKP